MEMWLAFSPFAAAAESFFTELGDPKGSPSYGAGAGCGSALISGV